MAEHNGGNPPAPYQGIHRLSHSELAELTPPVLNAAYARQTTGLACQSFLNSEPEKTGRRPKSDTAKAATFGAVDRSIIDSFITCMVDDEVFARTMPMAERWQACVGKAHRGVSNRLRSCAVRFERSLSIWAWRVGAEAGLPGL
jgi:hypothetical protein